MLKLLLEKKYGGTTKSQRRLDSMKGYLNSRRSPQEYAAAPGWAMGGDMLKSFISRILQDKAAKEQGQQSAQYAQALEQEQQNIENAQEQDYQGDIYRDQRDFGLRNQQANQKNAYMQGMLALKRQGLQNKLSTASQQGSPNNPFKGDPQAMSVWRSLTSAADKRAFEQMYLQDRTAAFAAVEDVMKKNKGLSSLFGLLSEKEPSGKYKMTTDPMKSSQRVLSYDEYATEVIKEKGDIPAPTLRKAYDAYLRSYGMSGIPSRRSSMSPIVPGGR
jgi:hypothetical protein